MSGRPIRYVILESTVVCLTDSSVVCYRPFSSEIMGKSGTSITRSISVESLDFEVVISMVLHRQVLAMVLLVYQIETFCLFNLIVSLTSSIICNKSTQVGIKVLVRLLNNFCTVDLEFDFLRMFLAIITAFSALLLD